MSGALVLLFVLGALASAWGILRWLRPELEKKWRVAFVGGASALGGILLAILTLGASRKKPSSEPEPEPEPKPPSFDDEDHHANASAAADTDADPVPDNAVDAVIGDILSERSGGAGEG